MAGHAAEGNRVLKGMLPGWGRHSVACACTPSIYYLTVVLVTADYLCWIVSGHGCVGGGGDAVVVVSNPG
jgi:hypothetical protein